MGLDVGLIKVDDLELYEHEYDQTYAERDRAFKSIGGYEMATDEQKKKIWAKESELQKAVEIKYNYTRVENNSTKYPEHMFKIGYFRSSYNDGGINHILRNYGLQALDEIFGVGNQSHYYVKPIWSVALTNTRETLAAFNKQLVENPYAVRSFANNPFTGTGGLPTDETGALHLFIEEKKKQDPETISTRWYSNVHGEFNFTNEPMQVVGVIHGVGLMNKPCQYVIYKATDMMWYTQALEIVQETIEYVMSQPDSDKYRLTWSG